MKEPKYLPWLVIFSAALFFFYEFIQMQMFNAISHSLLSDFHINATTLGYMSSSYFLADVIFLLPAGMLLDRFSPKKIIVMALWVSVISTVLFSRSHSVLIAAMCHFAAGIGNAFSLLSCIRIASRWFKPAQMALVVGLIVMFGMFGGMAAQTPMTWLASDVGWRGALLVTAGVGLLIIIIIELRVQDYPNHQKNHYDQQHHEIHQLGFKKSFYQVLSNKQNWLCGLYTSFVNIPLMLLGGLWGGLYLTTLHNVTRLQASYVTSMLFLGTMIGCPVIGALSDHFSRRRILMIIFGFLSLFIMISIIYTPDLTLLELIILFFGLGFLTSSQILSYPLISESNPPSITGTATGLAAVLVMGAPMLFEPLYGWFMDKNWDGTLLNGVHVYSAHAYHDSMLMILGILLLGCLLSFGVRETYARQS